MVSAMRLPLLLSTLVLTFALPACKTSERDTTEPPSATAGPGHGKGPMHDDEFEGREVVVNYEAQPGDVTICPYSGKKFEVKADSPRFEWNDKSWVFCCDMCIADVQADPEKYLGKYLDPIPPAVEEATTTTPPSTPPTTEE